MGRPRSDRAPEVIWNVKLLLFSPEDNDLIALYRQQVEGSRVGASVVKAAMRSGNLDRLVAANDATDAEVFGLLDELLF